jgi:two-component system chemotaxis response regulator CheB
MVRPDRLVLSRAAKVNRARPAVDPLSCSAARWFGPRVIGVILSGSLDDGAVGLAAIHQCGGVSLTQDPEEALFPGMPQAPLAAVPAAKALPIDELAAAVIDLAGQPVPSMEPDLAANLVAEMDMVELDAVAGLERLGEAVSISCPECRGGMTRIDSTGTVHYRCHVGHSYSPQNMLAAQSEAAETALWAAVAILEEQEAVNRHLAEHAVGLEKARRREAQARAAAAAESVRRILASSSNGSRQPADD